ncbi:hypothetical protein evm_011882 [Chilo suppressalis]|nr:hypothetical protein evm_011882 [Chilo suppressalis]
MPIGKKIHADQAADGTRTRTLRNPGECTDQLCYHGPDGRVEIFLALSCKAAPSLRIVGNPQCQMNTFSSIKHLKEEIAIIV